MARERTLIVMIGAFSPITHGIAVVNGAILEQLQAAGATTLVFNVSVPNLNRKFLLRMRRLPKVIRTIVSLACMKGLRGANLYMSISGGLGQIYEILFACTARIRGMKLHLHHHSFAYLNSRCLFTHILLGVAGSSSLHIALSERMADRMKILYMTKQTVTISNAVFILRKKLAVNTSRKELKTIGFIGNISVEKGVLEFFDLMILIETEKFPLQAKMAGNFEDYRVKSFVKKRLEKMQKVEYIGPKYGIDKDDFFNLIDVLVLPTRYVNEAEPLVILEAMSSGVPVIAYGRGCIPEVVGNESGLVIDTNEDFAPVALEQIKAWLGNPRSFESASKAAADRFIEQYSENKKRWLVLLNSLFG